MKARTLALLAAMLLIPILAMAGRMDIRKPAYDQVLKYENQGYSVKDDIQIGELAEGKSYYFDTQLTTGIDYFFHFQGDQGVRSLRLEMYDENWDLVAQSTGTGEPATVALKPEWSGTFHVKATLVECQGGMDYWFILAGYK
ncbi:hypothetical protein SAMN02745704_01530 [Paucidesulfovibrio gracilis DSM 16080]|uniref:Uncharacterized protein n=1 Tax=Paucidesulfovibrio gracilis DSM 16080 TaxID=1121449 RepID=A0A1T4WY20_9BACT|nr:hypothetical protein [Paucidesulfovibrio gracilis]SKA82252.1 hypothetical protein SAMN02745704_01530 [Paucidesulfovibrio gracilis DSM 16080]